MINIFNYRKKQKKENIDYNYEKMCFDTYYAYISFWQGIDQKTVKKMNIRTILNPKSKVDRMPCISFKDCLQVKNVLKKKEFNKYIFKSDSNNPQWDYVYIPEYSKNNKDYIVCVEGWEMGLFLAQLNINVCLMLGTYLTCKQKKIIDDYKKVYLIYDDDIAGETMFLRFKSKFQEKLVSGYVLKKGDEYNVSKRLEKVI